MKKPKNLKLHCDRANTLIEALEKLSLVITDFVSDGYTIFDSKIELTGFDNCLWYYIEINYYYA